MFNKSKIRAPVHLTSGNEKQLIKIFKKKKFLIMTGYFVHGITLSLSFKGVPQNILKKEIVKGKSISLCFIKIKFIHLLSLVEYYQLQLELPYQ